MRHVEHSTGGRLTRRKFLKASLGASAVPAFLSVTASPAESPGQRFFLVKSDRPLPRIVRGREDGHAAQVLASALKRLTGKEAIVAEEMAGSGNRAPVILVGSATSNKAVADLLGREPLAHDGGSVGGRSIRILEGLPAQDTRARCLEIVRRDH